MATLFYDSLIDLDDLLNELSSLPNDPDQTTELHQLVDEIFHHHILDFILTHLPREHHEEFLDRIKTDPAHPGHLTYLQEKITIDFNVRLQDHGARLKQDLLKELRQARSAK